MLFLLFALVLGLFVALPFVFTGRAIGGLIAGAITTVVFWPLFYVVVPTLAGPFFGTIGVFCAVAGTIAGVVAYFSALDDRGSTAPLGLGFAVILVGALLGRGCANSEMLNASDYASKLGTVQERVWTQDVQPKDQHHVRLVPHETAAFLADKQLGSAGAIGSQYTVDKSRMTLQIVRGELWYVAPLDFNGFSVWQTKGTTPGYVMVHGEDPVHEVVVKTDRKFRYMPEAFFGDNLERYLWSNGYADKYVSDYTFELDEVGNPFWTATVSEPTIGWWAPRVLGVVLVNPETGDIKFQKLGEVDAWVDRVIPFELIHDYVSWWGSYGGGWWNRFYGKLNLLRPEAQSLVYGSDNDPYWVTSVTSTNNEDESLVALIYTDARTGTHVKYAARGSTEAGILQAVNNKVQYKKYHGASPVLYNIYGRMAYIVPLVGENHVFQGVAIADVQTPQVVAVGDDAHSAFREFQRLLSQTGQQAEVEKSSAQQELTGTVDRFACEHAASETRCYVHLTGVPHLFTGDSSLSAKLPLTEKGDEVVIGFVASGEDVEPMLTFDNRSLPLERTAGQTAVQDREQATREQWREMARQQSDKGVLENMSADELRELLKLREAQKQKKQ